MDYYAQAAFGVGIATAVYTAIMWKTLSYCAKRYDKCPTEKPKSIAVSDEDLKESLNLT